MTTLENLLELREISKTYVCSRGLLARRQEQIVAVDEVSFSIRRGETFGIVGESGCGKTTLARLILHLTKPSSGVISFGGTLLSSAGAAVVKTIRTRMQMVFQDPYASLNPRKTLHSTLAKPFRLHTSLSSAEMRSRILGLLEDVGLSPAAEFANRYPHELSGGQRQRVVIARAIALKPDLVVADEPVSALDVSVRAQVLNLLQQLKKKHNLTLLFISHDLSIVRSLCDRVAVMYLGRIVETGATEDIFEHALHPYTQVLLACTPIPNPRLMRSRIRIAIEGEIPSAAQRPPGCPFHTRCPMRDERCDVHVPLLRTLEASQEVACHYAERNLRSSSA